MSERARDGLEVVIRMNAVLLADNEVGKLATMIVEYLVSIGFEKRKRSRGDWQATVTRAVERILRAELLFAPLAKVIDKLLHQLERRYAFGPKS